MTETANGNEAGAASGNRSVADPRPLTSEPLSMDLVNTRWLDAAGRLHDLLDDDEGLAVWLAAPQTARALEGAAVPAAWPTREALLATRTALIALVARPDDGAARDALNEVLAHGRLRRLLTEDGPAATAEADPVAWLPAWAAANDYLRLRAEGPDRIRACAYPPCVLHFYDISRNGTRRWCSMAGCGNRVKASRHHARHRR